MNMNSFEKNMPECSNNIYGYIGTKNNIIEMNNMKYETQTGGYGKKKNDQYINLKINGRLFPTWILANFNMYKMPEIFLDGSDPCNISKISSELRKYQEFLGKYLDYN